MIDIQQLIELDKRILLALNGSDSLFADGVMMVITSTLIWIPVGIVLLYIIIKKHTFKEFFLTLCAIALTVVLCDQIASGLCKPLFERLRPTQDPDIMYLVDIVNGYRGGRYGFISSHAANTFGLCVFLSLLFRRPRFTVLMFVWALLSSYSRIYLGVHYLGDVLCGALVGCLVGALVYWIYKRVNQNFTYNNQRWVSNLYTSSGYLKSDINLLILVLLLTYSAIPFIGLLVVSLNSY